MAKIMIAKVGTDAHDMGLTVIEQWLSEAGHEVINLGLYNSPKRVAEAAAREKPDVVGLSFLGGEPVYLSGRVLEELGAAGMEDTKLVAGGVLTPEMVEKLKAMGLAATYTPGTARETILESLAAIVAGERRNLPPEKPKARTGAPGG
jgi:methylmalonyl-CoA mutase cobalamin-binding domain/chain